MKKKKIKIKTEKKEKKNPVITIKVVGIGGGGVNAVSRMSENFIRGVDFIGINTDHQDLDQAKVRHKVYIGKSLTRGLGTGMNPDLGRQAAEENRSEIAEALKGADLIFLAAGLGGGTGTGGAPIVAEVAKQSGALTLAFVTKPFSFEGSQRERIAQEGLGRLKDKVDALIVVPNDRIFTVIDKEVSLTKAFEAIDDVLRNALHGIVEVIITPGFINLDFADMRTIVEGAGSAIVGMGIASGSERAIEAVNQALNSPLLEVSAEGAKGVLLGISGGRDLKMSEINEAARLVAQAADPAARIIFGAYRHRSLKPNQMKITLVATGFNGTLAAHSLFNVQQTKTGFMGAAKKPEPAVEKAAEDLGEPLFAKEKTILASTDKTENNHETKAKKAEKEAEVWDIPTFLRRKKR